MVFAVRMSRSRRYEPRRIVCLLLAPVLMLLCLIGASHASAIPLPPSSFGFELAAPTAPAGSTSWPMYNVGEARYGSIDSSDADSLVTMLAKEHLRLYPSLGIPCPSSNTNCGYKFSPTPADAATAISQVVTSFAQRYGVNGTFWQANSKLPAAQQLPYEPVLDFEIGNEENEPLQWVVDSSHLHWNSGTASETDNGAAEYAQVYDAARTALHAVDPSAVAVVGGLADSAYENAGAPQTNVDVNLDLSYLQALNPADVDAVGYHNWVYDKSNAQTILGNLKADTVNLRSGMDKLSSAWAKVPLHVSEFGACYTTSGNQIVGECDNGDSMSDSQWAPSAAAYVRWAMCAPSLNIDNIQPFYWGGTPNTDSGVFLPLASGSGVLTQFGSAYLGVVKDLTANGCAGSAAATTAVPTNTSTPTVQGTPVVGDALTASPGIWTGSPQFTFQWESCDTAGSNCAAINAGTSSTYTPQLSDLGRTLVVVVTGTNAGGGNVAQSAATAPVTVLPSPVSPPTTGGSQPVGKPKVSPKASLTSMDVRVVRLTRHGRRVTIVVSHRAQSGTMVVTGTRTVHRKRVSRGFKGRRTSKTTTSFAAVLPTGRWTLAITAKPAKGYAKPAAKLRVIRVVVRKPRAKK